MTIEYNRLTSLLAAAFAISWASCGGKRETEGNDVQERLSGTGSSSWQDASLVESTLSGRNGVRINARTNYTTFYENGRPVAKWKVATARSGKSTPKGIFAIHSKDVCPPWSLNGKSVGPCAPENPLGKKALWFDNGFSIGMHGVNPGAIWSVTDPNPRNRDQSSGCVRNHPENIEWIFARVQVGTPVVVGLWDHDPNVVDCSGNAALCNSQPSPSQSQQPQDDQVTGGSSDLLTPAPVVTPPPVVLPMACPVVAKIGSSAQVFTDVSQHGGQPVELRHGDIVTVLKRGEGNLEEFFLVDSEKGQGYMRRSQIGCQL